MAAKTEQKIAAAGMVGAVLALLALVLLGLMVGLGARDDRVTISAGDHR
jgi:hypothetical protein